MQRCFTLYDVQSQPQYSMNQRRVEMMNERVGNDEEHVNSDTDRSDMAQTQVPETQENEEVDCVNIDDESRPSIEFIRDPVQIPSSRIQQRGRVNRGISSQRSAGSSRVAFGSGPRGARRRQSFETTLTNTMAGFREFQRQSFLQLCPGAFEAMEVTKFSDFWCKCMHQLQEDRFWRKYFINKAESSNEDKIQFLEALTGCTRHGETCEKRLGSRQHYGSPSSSGVLSGSPSSGGNNSWGQTSHGQWGHGFQQSGPPPNAPQWGTPPNAQKWSSQPNPQQWSTPPNTSQWGTQPNPPQWGTPQNAPQWSSPQSDAQWGKPSNTQQWGSSSNDPQWGYSPNDLQRDSSPNANQWGSSSNVSQWGSSPNARQWAPTKNVQHGFSLGGSVENAPNAQTGVSAEAEARQTPRTHITGGLFNIWGNQRGPDLNESQQNTSEDED